MGANKKGIIYVCFNLQFCRKEPIRNFIKEKHWKNLLPISKLAQSSLFCLKSLRHQTICWRRTLKIQVNLVVHASTKMNKHGHMRYYLTTRLALSCSSGNGIIASKTITLHWLEWIVLDNYWSRSTNCWKKLSHSPFLNFVEQPHCLSNNFLLLSFTIKVWERLSLSPLSYSAKIRPSAPFSCVVKTCDNCSYNVHLWSLVYMIFSSI